MTAPPMTTQALLALLRRHYIKPGADLPGGMFLPEVGRNGARQRRCDAIYVGFTSTSGRLLIGHELKVTRADWLAELNNPGKADVWADDCHEWWLVTPPGIVQEGELPPGWGHLIPGHSKTRMKVATRATRHADRTPSWDTVRSIIARQDTLRAEAIRQGITAAADRIRTEQQARIDEMVEHRLRRQGDTTLMREELNAYREDLGGRLDLTRDDHAMFDGFHTRKDLRVAAELLRHHRNLRAALAGLTGPYTAMRHLRHELDRLDKALTDAVEAVTRER